MTPFTITTTAPKATLEESLGYALKAANLTEPLLGQARVAGLGAIRMALALTMGLDDATLHVELTGDGLNVAAKVGIS